MQLPRAQLLEKLDNIAPALADNDMVPVLKHFVFTGSKIVAYNDRIALSVNQKTDFKGAVPGKIMLDLMRTLSSENIDLSSNNDAMQLKTPHSRVVLAMLPQNEFEFQMPTLKAPVPVNSAFIDAIEDCLQSVSAYAVVPDQLGITVIPDGKKLALYSTNSATMSHATVTTSQPLTKRRVILSTDFCKQMLRLAKESQEADEEAASCGNLSIDTDNVLFQTKKATLFGRLIESSDPLPFEATFKRHMPNGSASKMVKIPEQFKELLTRAALITDIQGREIKTEIKVDNGLAVLKSQSERGEARDQVKITGHPSVNMNIAVKLILAGIERYDVEDKGKLLLTQTCAILSRGNSLYLAACQS